MQFKKWAGVAAALLTMSVASANEDGAALLQSFVDDAETFSADFEQTLVDAQGNVIEESAGTLQLQRPGRFRWSYATPYEQLLVADGLNVWSYDADLEQVTVKAQDEVLASTPAVLLGGGGDVLDDFELVESFTDRGTVWVRLLPQVDNGSFESVDLGFTDGTLSRMIFIDSLEQSTLIALHNVVVNEPIPPGRFAYTPPADADLVGKPVAAAKTDNGN